MVLVVDKKGFGIIDILIIVAVVVLVIIASVPQMIVREQERNYQKDFLLKQEVATALDRYSKMYHKYTDSFDSLQVFLSLPLTANDSLVKLYDKSFENVQRDSILQTVNIVPVDSLMKRYSSPVTHNPFTIQVYSFGREYRIFSDFAEHDTISSER